MDLMPLAPAAGETTVPKPGSMEDFDGDGYPYLVVLTEDVDSTYAEGDTLAALIGQAFDRQHIQEQDTVCIVP